MDILDLPIYVINLDRRPDRWTQFQDLSGIDIFKHLRRWSATDGKKIEIQGNREISLHTRYNIKRNMRRSHHEINTTGAIGASYSHYRIWSDLLAGSATGCIVFEDDIYLDPEFIQRMRTTWSHAPACDMFLFGNAWMHDDVKYQGNYNKVLGFNGAHAYYISRDFAEILCRNFFPIEMHVEFYIFKTAQLYDRLILHNKNLCVKFMSQVNGIQDSDTFFSKNTCPACVIPDDMTGLYIEPQKLRENVALIGAVSMICIGSLLAYKKA